MQSQSGWGLDQERNTQRCSSLRAPHILVYHKGTTVSVLFEVLILYVLSSHLFLPPALSISLLEAEEGWGKNSIVVSGDSGGVANPLPPTNVLNKLLLLNLSPFPWNIKSYIIYRLNKQDIYFLKIPSQMF